MRAIWGLQLMHPIQGALRCLHINITFFFTSTHAPYTGCDAAAQRGGLTANTSTHAPYTGCDHMPLAHKHGELYFNSRTLYRVRCLHTIESDTPEDFNSRTLYRVRSVAARRRQIHSDFNSRTLYRVRLTVQQVVARAKATSTHAPYTGCD